MADLNLSRHTASSDQQQQLHGAVRPASPTQDRQPDDIQRPRLEQPENERRVLLAPIQRLETTLAADRTAQQELQTRDAAAVRDAGDAETATRRQQQALQLQIGINTTADLEATRQRLFALTPAPAPSQLPDHNLLVRFWQALHAGQVTQQVVRLNFDTNQMVEVDPAARQPLQMDRVPSRVANLVDIHLLTLPEGVFWLGRPELGSDLMVRDCYSGLFDQITAPKFATQLRWVVTGNPAIGKTFFSGYFIYRLLQQNPQLTVVYEPAEMPAKNRYLLQNDGTVLSGVYSPNDNFVDECFRNRRDDVWFIADGHTPTFYGNARTLLVTSPCSNFDKKLLKEYASKLYMPVWSWNELSCCLRHSLRRENADSARILSAMHSANERFRHWGGIARVVLGAVFGSDEIDWLNDLDRAIRSLSLRTLLSLGQPVNELIVFDPVLHIEVLPALWHDSDGRAHQSFLRGRMIFASDWVRDTVLNNFVQWQRDDLVRFLRSSHGLNDSASYTAVQLKSELIRVLNKESASQFCPTIGHLNSL